AQGPLAGIHPALTGSLARAKGVAPKFPGNIRASCSDPSASPCSTVRNSCWPSAVWPWPSRPELNQHHPMRQNHHPRRLRDLRPRRRPLQPKRRRQRQLPNRAPKARAKIRVNHRLKLRPSWTSQALRLQSLGLPPAPALQTPLACPPFPPPKPKASNPHARRSKSHELPPKANPAIASSLKTGGHTHGPCSKSAAIFVCAPSCFTSSRSIVTINPPTRCGRGPPTTLTSP